MGNVSFYCTRCRHLTKFPDSCRESIVRCPFCQQALIVPSIPSDGEYGSKERTPVPAPCPHEVSESDAPGYYAFNAVDSGVLVRSHLSPDKSRRIVPNADEPNSIRSVDVGGETVPVPSESESSIFSLPSDVSDAEFIRRLHDDEPKTSPIRPAVPPPFVPESNGAYSQTPFLQESDGKSTRFQYAVISIAVLLTVLLSVVIGIFSYRAGRSNAINPTLAAPEPITVEGRVVYRDALGRDEGDEGALLFFFPTDVVFDKPLIASGLSPQNAETDGLEEFFDELRKKGGYYATAGFDGYFSLEIAEPGDYRLLVVSKHIEDSVDVDDQERIAEISKYLFLPERKLLARNRFLWSTETIDKGLGAIEKDFGKSANNVR